MINLRNAIIVAVSGLLAANGLADIQVVAPSFTTGASGSFNVPMRITSPDVPFDINGYFLDLRVTPQAGSVGSLVISLASAADAPSAGVGTPFFDATPACMNFSTQL